MRTVALVLGLLILAFFGAILFGPALYVKFAGPVTQGEVVSKREFFKLPGGDRWSHVFEITYRYRPPGESVIYTASESVDRTVYDRHPPGEPIAIRYSPWPELRRWKGVGSVSDETSFLSRFNFLSDSCRLLFDIASLAVVALLGFLAWRLKAHGLILAAVFGAAVVLSGIVPVGFAVFPLLLGLARKYPRRGYGLVLLASMAVSTPVLYWRIPKPPPPPGPPVRHSVATVRNVVLVDEIWSTSHEAGEELPQPFQLADLEFVPVGAAHPIHILDMVDANSVPGLAPGAQVPIAYSAVDSRQAQIDGATRSWHGRAFWRLLQLTYGIGALVTLGGWLLLRLKL